MEFLSWAEQLEEFKTPFCSWFVFAVCVCVCVFAVYLDKLGVCPNKLQMRTNCKFTLLTEVQSHNIYIYIVWMRYCPQ